MRCGNRNNASYELRTNSQEFVQSSYALWPQEYGSVGTPYGLHGSSYGLCTDSPECVRSLHTLWPQESCPARTLYEPPGEFVRAPYEFRMNSPESVRSLYVCAVPAGIRTRTNSALTPREFVRAAYGLRANAPEFLWSSYGPRTHSVRTRRSSYGVRMRCGRRNKAPCKLCTDSPGVRTNSPGVRTGSVRTSCEPTGVRMEFVRTPYACRRVRTEFL